MAVIRGKDLAPVIAIVAWFLDIIYANSCIVANCCWHDGKVCVVMWGLEGFIMVSMSADGQSLDSFQPVSDTSILTYMRLELIKLKVLKDEQVPEVAVKVWLLGWCMVK